MIKKELLVSLALAVGLTATAIPTVPALADGAASTRNILFVGAAAAALVVINHNKQVHAKYDEDARRQAAAEESANNAQAAYATEKRLYANQVALNKQYQREVDIQHGEIVKLRDQVAYEKRFAQPVPAAAAARASGGNAAPLRVATVSYGWGAL